jgi:hypothetical protein
MDSQLNITALNRRITEATEEAYVAQQEAEEAVETLHRLRGQRINALRNIAINISTNDWLLLTFSDGRQLVGRWWNDKGPGSCAGFFQPKDGTLVRVELDALHFIEVYEGE